MADDLGRLPEDEDLLQRWLDGELSPQESAALEERLARDPALAGRAATLRRMETWLAETRPAAPPTLATRVLDEIAPARRTHDERHSQSRTARLVSLRAWAWAPVAAAAALVLLFAWRGTRPPEPTGGEAPGPASQHASAASDSVRCTFQFAAKDAREVCLVGNFNRWKVCDTPLRPTPDGNWAVTVELPRGRYEYVFVVDGQWMPNPAAPLRVDDGFGGQKAILLL